MVNKNDTKVKEKKLVDNINIIHEILYLSPSKNSKENGWNQQVFRARSVCGADIDARNYLTVFEFKTKAHLNRRVYKDHILFTLALTPIICNQTFSR